MDPGGSGIARMRKSYDWQKRAVAFFAVAVVFLSFFLAAFAIREAEREKLVKQAELKTEPRGIAAQIHDRFELLVSEAELRTFSHFDRLNEDPDAQILKDAASAIQTATGWVDTVLLIKRSGEIDFLLEKPLYAIDAAARDSRIAAFSDVKDPLMSAAEEAEFRQKNFTSARRFYRELFNKSANRSLRANLLHSMGRCYLQSGRPLEAIPIYQDILKSHEHEFTPDGTPVGLLALYQIGTAYSRADMPGPAMEESLKLYKDLLESRWLMPRARFQTYLKQTKDRLLSLEKVLTADPAGADLVDQWQALLGVETDRLARMNLLESIVRNIRPNIDRSWDAGLETGEFSRFTFSEENRSFMISFSPIHDTLFLGMMYKNDYLIEHILPDALSAYTSPHPWEVSITDGAGNVLAGDAVLSTPGAVPELNFSRVFDLDYPAWEIHIFMPSPNPAERAFQKRRLLYILIALVVTAALVGGGTMAIRGTAKELRLARLKSEFVSTVSHEFRTPLTSIRYLSELLERGRVKEESQKLKYYQTITRESERLSRLIENTLDFSKIEAGMKKYEFTETDVAELVEEATGGFRNQIAPKKIVVGCEIAKDLPKVDLDKEAVRRALLNLLDNAFKYSGESRNIQVRAWADPKFIYIAVEDHGIGIAPEEQKKVFEKFYRSEHNQESHIRGSGIGLTLVTHIAHAHGGDVVLDSQPGKGTTVTLRFPLDRAG